jgi:putative peptide zinc metalloprotease protein
MEKTAEPLAGVLPKLRSDLTLRSQVAKDGRFLIVKDPELAQFFRFGETEEYILRQLDGKTTLDTIRMRVEEHFGDVLEPEVLQGFIDDLDANGMLEGSARSSARSGHRGRMRGSWLYLRFKLFDPTRIFDWLAGGTAFFYTAFFLALSAAVILLAVDTAIVNSSDLLKGFRDVAAPSAIPLYVAVAFITIGLHEFAHGLTCRHFGGEVHEIGFLLIYFQPALYCNVSDAWLFPEKAKRLWVSFAGPYFELFIWALAMLTWRATETGTFLNGVSLAVVGISGVKTLFNFNPLIKLDGYYLLSDFLEMPNLRKKSFRSLGVLIGRLFERSLQIEGETRRERTIYLCYGLVAACGSFALMGSLLFTASRYLGDGAQPAFLAIPVATGLVIKGRRWSRRLFAGSSNRSSEMADDPDFDGIASVSPSQERTVTSVGQLLETDTRAFVVNDQLPAQPRILYARRKWPRRVAYGVLALLALACLSQVPAPMRIKGAFVLLPGENTDVRVSVDGIIDRLYVNEGDKVNAGDLIAVLSDRDVRTSLDKTEAEIREAQAKLRMLRAGSTVQEIAVAKANVDKAAEQQKFAERKLERSKLMLDAGLLARSGYEEVEEQTAAARGVLAETKAELDAVVNSVRPEQIDAVVAEIDRLETQRRLTQRQLQSLRVVSPVAGVVGTPSRQLLQMVQQFVRKGDPVAKIYGFQTVKAQIMISEKEISVIKVGQPVQLKARAYPEATFHGQVTFIATSASEAAAASQPSTLAATAAPVLMNSGGKSINEVFVNTEIDNHSLLLKPEMTGRARIDCGRVPLGELFMWHVRRYFRVDSLAW